MILHQTTIDPETLPVVQQLRAELARVTEERDAAVRAVTKIIKEDCNPCGFCENSGALCGGAHPDFCSTFKWRKKKGGDQQ